ncbi:hypothetical protein Y032_0126g1341 [Ancylostoma ceylanicum]|uniref:Uncharacterized protein n=1 Tax=Ancylostoma ceylanicum TaxID=53326 RepID=A0A016T8P1_9BILA|nr:hypothetical protein Y032_0126g1341 [Ancylostoma ceylanicum]
MGFDVIWRPIVIVSIQDMACFTATLSLRPFTTKSSRATDRTPTCYPTQIYCNKAQDNLPLSRGWAERGKCMCVAQTAPHCNTIAKVKGEFRVSEGIDMEKGWKTV